MSQKMTLNDKVKQISLQLEICETYSEFRLIPILENFNFWVNSNGRFDSFFMPIDAEISEEIERVEGLYSMVEDYILEGRGKERFLRLRTSTEHRAMFIPFISEITDKDLSDPKGALNETLKDWRNIWKGNTGRLDKRQQRGLLGELLVLYSLVKKGNIEVLKNWVGPLGNTHDFESENLNLEVKTTIKQPASVQISLIKQVAPMEGKKVLNLIIVGLQKGEDLSLISMITKIRDLLEDTTLENDFETTLMKSGFRDHHSSFYEQKYSLMYFHKHEITEKSPVLKPSILGEIPATVSNIKYTLDVHGMELDEVNEEDWMKFNTLMKG